MGFFFLTETNRAIKKSAKKRNVEALNKFGCSVCPLNKANNKTPKMQPTLAPETWIYWLGQNPGRQEDEDGSPFVGPSGQLLRHCLTDDIIVHSSFDNIVRDRTPRVTSPDGSVKDRDPIPTEIEACRCLVTKSIEETKPKLIVGLGMLPQYWALKNTDQQGMRGRIFTIKVGSHTCYFMPTYHPARVLRTAGERGRDKSYKEILATYHGRTFQLDVEKACKFIENRDYPIIETESEIRKDILTFNGNDWEKLCVLLGNAQEAPEKAIDIETQGLRPYAKDAAILAVAISYDNVNVSFALDHPQSKWTKLERNTLKAFLKSILIDNTIKIAHNATFECEWFAYFLGRDCIRHEVWECTQLQAHFIDERRGAGQSNDEETKRATYQGLGFLVEMYFGVPFKDWFQLNKKNMAEEPISEMMVYNAADTLFCLRLWHRQNAILHEQVLYEGYVRALHRQPTIALMQLIGLPVNQTKVTELQTRLDGEIKVIEAEIESLDVVRQYKKDHKEFHPMGDDAITIFSEYLNRKEVKIQEGTKVRWSVDKNILDKIDHPLSKLIIKLRNKVKMKSTYVDGLELGKGGLVWDDGKIHCNFNSTFTTTGRTSSDFPNMQNFPSRSDSWVREQIQAPDKHTIVAADFGQLEMCGAAMCSEDEVLVKALWEDYDTHMEWAARLASLVPDRVGGDFNDVRVAKQFRSLVKNKLVFPAIYGATNGSIAGYLSLDVSYIDTLMKEFWSTFDGIKDWQDRLLRKYRKCGYVETLTGRRRHHPLTSNEAINSPIQGTASDIVVDAMNRLSRKASIEGKWHLHPILNIHDDLTFIIPDNKLEESIEIIYKALLSPDFDFINVPLSVELKFGRNWYAMEELGKFWSHKDL